MTSFFSPLVAFSATLILILLLRPVAALTGLVDVPNDRSSHTRPTPLVGGLAIFFAIVIAYLIPASMELVPLNRQVLSFFTAGLLLIGVGVVDDCVSLSSPVRFIAQIAASLVMIFGADVVITDIGAISYSGNVIYLGWLSVPFTVFATLGIINAVNMSDGIDGLSGTLALISLIGLLMAASLGGGSLDGFILTLIAASVFGFLLFNVRLFRRKHASIFMGDAGSMFIGLSLTWFTISLAQGANRAITPAAGLWFLMLPIFDTVAMMFRRAVRRRSPFSPDKEHIHHMFLMAGFTVNECVTIMAAAALIGVGVGLLSMDIVAPEFSVAGLFVVAGLLYMWMILRSWKVMHFLERSICRRRSGEDRRSGPERRSGVDSGYGDLEKRSGVERRRRERRSVLQLANASRNVARESEAAGDRS